MKFSFRLTQGSIDDVKPWTEDMTRYQPATNGVWNSWVTYADGKREDATYYHVDTEKMTEENTILSRKLWRLVDRAQLLYIPIHRDELLTSIIDG